MMKLIRPPAPNCLKDKSKNNNRPNYRQWGHDYKKARDNNSSDRFNWRTYKGQTADKIIKEKLVKMTSNHCSFCDSFPLGVSSQQTIEHFIPKSKKPRLAYTWPNLFLCCNVCQSAKGEKYEPGLLKPDKDDYDFHKYFISNYATGEIKINPSLTEKDRNKARTTIDLYGLNNEGRPQSRLRIYKRYKKLTSKNKDEEINDFPYRFFLE